MDMSDKGPLCVTGVKNSQFEDFLQAFKDTFVPWCLNKQKSESVHLDLLLALLEDECIEDQWNIIMSYALEVEHGRSADISIDPDVAAFLSVLLQKARDKIKSMVQAECKLQKHLYVKRWHHKLLDSLALAVACTTPLYTISEVNFLWYIPVIQD